MSETCMDRRRMWPTPAANDDDNKSPQAHMAMKARMKGGPRYTITSLQVAVKAEVTGFEIPVTDASRQLTLFAEAFPASRTRSLADVPVPRTSATSGHPSLDSFASVNPDGSWRKTCQGYSQVTLDGSLERFSETWPRAGMTRNGRAFQRVPLVRLTDATASGSWPTPDASAMQLGETPETWLARRETLKAKGYNGNGCGTPLAMAVQLWPTPCAEDAKNVPYQKGKDGVTRYPMRLGAVDPARLWPMPASRDYRSPSLKVGTPEYFRHPTAGIPLPEAAGGTLNPTWVEWLMGYPLGWTACAASATPSSRKSRNGSRTASATPTSADE